MGDILKFRGVDGLDVCNGVLFEKYIIGRVEPSMKDNGSKVMFFRKNGDNDYLLHDTAPTFDLQDPFITRIKDELVLGGVKIYPIRTRRNDRMSRKRKYKRLGYETIFYKGNNIEKLELVGEGVDGMKDIRLVELPDENAIGVFTRPERKVKEDGNTKYIKEIGFTKINSLDEFNKQNIKAAKPIIKFAEDEFGGVNEAYLLEDGEIGVLGHIAYVERGRYSTDKKHYYAKTFRFNPKTYQISDLKIIATRDNFPEGQTKELPGRNPDHLKDVIFPTGIRKSREGTTILYAGLSDKEMGKADIPYPFWKDFLILDSPHMLKWK